MTDSKSKRLRRGLVTTTTTTRVERDGEPLTHEEERVVRMLHGLGEGDDFELTFAESPNAEVNTRLKLMEAMLMAEMHGQGPLAESSRQTPRQKILSRLRELEDDD